MNELQIFNSAEYGQIRTVAIDGEPWMVGKDVAVALGYQNPSKALIDHVDDEDKLNNESLLSLDSEAAGLSTKAAYTLWFCPVNFQTQRSSAGG